MNKKPFLVLAALLLIIFACRKTDELHEDQDWLGFQKPAYFPEPVYNLASNQTTEAGFKLGRTLFYDGILSRDNQISCGSCHIASHAFTQHGHDVSHGVDDKVGIRNSMPLFNLAWSDSFFWDGGVFHLDLFPIAPIENPVEMDEKLPNVLNKLKASSSYRKMFLDAFGSEEINSTKMFKALSQFMLSIVSADSKYDKVQRKEATFNAEELSGYKIFQAKCNSCHQEPLFTDHSFRDNGIGENLAKDQGRWEISQLENDRLKFKVPSLRNLKATAPYMHDGSFRTLDAVIRHYRQEVQPTPNLDPLLKKEMGIKLTDSEVSQLMAFLDCLNDESFLRNPIFQEQL